mmetsp:Transcript_102579/g.319652  ORF Transcript_102579/g.319652 Transcript_102579/m.319652 type:complete len:254 (-) Transcript_102579:8-769(-)
MRRTRSALKRILAWLEMLAPVPPAIANMILTRGVADVTPSRGWRSKRWSSWSAAVCAARRWSSSRGRSVPFAGSPASLPASAVSFLAASEMLLSSMLKNASSAATRPSPALPILRALPTAAAALAAVGMPSRDPFAVSATAPAAGRRRAARAAAQGLWPSAQGPWCVVVLVWIWYSFLSFTNSVRLVSLLAVDAFACNPTSSSPAEGKRSATVLLSCESSSSPTKPTAAARGLRRSRAWLRLARGHGRPRPSI